MKLKIWINPDSSTFKTWKYKILIFKAAQPKCFLVLRRALKNTEANTKIVAADQISFYSPFYKLRNYRLVTEDTLHLSHNCY